MNTTTYSGMMDTAMSVRAQQQLLDERGKLLATRRRPPGPSGASRPSPTLPGLISPKKLARPRKRFYIGLASFADSPDHFLVYDWRAPISSIYYEGELGEASTTPPMANRPSM